MLCLPCGLPAVPKEASDSYLLLAPLGREDWREERLCLTLTQLFQEGFLSQALVLCPASLLLWWKWGRPIWGILPRTSSYFGILQWAPLEEIWA